MFVGNHGLNVAVTFLIAIIVVVHVDAHNSCTTPRGKAGICIPKSSCGMITQLLRLWPEPPPPQVVQFIELSQCRVSNDITYVCCEQTGVTFGGESAKQKQTIITPGSGFKILPSALKSDADVQSGMAILQASECEKTFSVVPPPIGHGQNAESLKYPWMALLVYTDDGLGITLDCGGSLITDRYVITAAHCIRRENKKLVKVRLGVHNTNESMCLDCPQPIQEIDVEEALYHKDYSPNQFINDIGLIRLFTKAIFRSNVKPICLPVTPESQEITVNRMTIAGWGLIETGQKANILQEAVVPVKDRDFCQQIHRLIRITENHLCAGGEDNVDTCKGDSGGPIFSIRHFSNGDEYYVLYGIVSAGSSRCGSNFPSIYTNVISYLPWIAGNLRP